MASYSTTSRRGTSSSPETSPGTRGRAASGWTGSPLRTRCPAATTRPPFGATRGCSPTSSGYSPGPLSGGRSPFGDFGARPGESDYAWGRRNPDPLNLRGAGPGGKRWKLCHVYSVAVGEPGNLTWQKRRFARLIHPFNMFLFPRPIRKGSGYYSTSRDLGEDVTVCREVAALIRGAVGETAWNEFLEVAGVEPEEKPGRIDVLPADQQVVLQFQARAPAGTSDEREDAMEVLYRGYLQSTGRLREVYEKHQELMRYVARREAMDVEAGGSDSPEPHPDPGGAELAVSEPDEGAENVGSPVTALVAEALLNKLNGLVVSNPARARETKFYLRTNLPGWRFEVEKPTPEKVRELLAAANGDLRLQNRGLTGRQGQAPQFFTQFGSCYLVQTWAWKDASHYLE